jgi:hypothetical protein
MSWPLVPEGGVIQTRRGRSVAIVFGMANLGDLPPMRYMLAFCCLAALATSALAMDVQTVRSMCQVDQVRCTVYYIGVTEGLLMENIAVHYYTGAYLFCPPNTSSEAYARIMIQYVEAHPEQWHTGAGPMALNALKQAFPCRG